MWSSARRAGRRWGPANHLLTHVDMQTLSCVCIPTVISPPRAAQSRRMEYSARVQQGKGTLVYLASPPPLDVFGRAEGMPGGSGRPPSNFR